MSETINVTLTANSADLETALSRASAAVGSFEKKARSARQIGMPEIALTPASLASMERAAFLQQDLARKTYQAGASGKAGALGFLAFSQAVEDAQYGVRGVLNNIPQMVLGFGGGAGLAGAFSLAAVGAFAAYQAFQKLSGIKEMEEWNKANTQANDAFTDSLKESRREAAALSEEIQSLNRLNETRERGMANVNRSVIVDPLILDGDRAAAAARQRQRSTQDQLLSAADSAASTELPAEQQFNNDNRRAARDYALEQQRLAQDLVIQQQQLNDAGKEYERIWQNIGTITTDYQNQKNTLISEEIEIRKNLAARQAEAARLQIQFESTKDPNNKRRFKLQLDDSRSEIEAIKATLTENKKQIEIADELIAATRREGDASNQALDTRRAKLKEDIAATEDAIKAREKLARVEAMVIRSRALKAQSPELDEALKAAEDVQKRTRETADDFFEKQQRQADTLQGGRGFAEKEANYRDIVRQAEEIAANTTFKEGPVRDELERLAAVQKLIDDNTGSVRDRGEARRAAREAEREEGRNTRRRDAALKRENARRKRAGEDPIDQPVDGAREAQQKADADRQKAQEAREKNAEEQLKTQQAIQKLIENLEFLPPLAN